MIRWGWLFTKDMLFRGKNDKGIFGVVFSGTLGLAFGVWYTGYLGVKGIEANWDQKHNDMAYSKRPTTYEGVFFYPKGCETKHLPRPYPQEACEAVGLPGPYLEE